MKLKKSHAILFPLMSALMIAVTSPQSFAASSPDYGQIEVAVGRLLEQGHYTRQKLNDAVSERFLKNYLDALDYNHLFFTQQDVDGFTAKYGTALDDDVLLGNPTPATAIFDVYKKRVEERVAKIEKMLKTEHFEFTGDSSVEVDRKKAAWPKDEAAADALWKKRIEGSVLQETLFQQAAKKKVAKKKNEGKKPKKSSKKIDSAKNSETKSSSKKQDEKTAKSESDNKDKTAAKKKSTTVHVPTKTPVEVVAHRYKQVLRNLHDMGKGDVMTLFLNTLAQTYDPHSNYFNKEDLENFNIDMKLSLVGIGAVLQSEGGYVKVMQLVPGGPAQMDGRLKVGDRVTSVAQGDKDFVDIVDMRIDKVVNMIRGKKGTVVRLMVIPAHSADSSSRQVIDIKRNVVKITEQEAHAELIEHKDADGKIRRIGWITLPAFYADMAHAGDKGAKSCTQDVLKLLNKLKAEHIDGLVIDLRVDGGGSLQEAINLSGLFTGKGPVVQTKDGNGKITVSKSDETAVYNGPMIVLINHLSASASEIFTGAMQDYGRAVIVGGDSFGKGTVQTLLNIGQFMPFLSGDPSQAGALKLTIQKFYRVSGKSTQLRGVIPDVKLPSIYARPDIGESALNDPLPYDQVAPAPHPMFGQPLHLKTLDADAKNDLAKNIEFRWINEDLTRLNQKLKENSVSLNMKTREVESAASKKRLKDRAAILAKLKAPKETVYDITLENLSKPKLQLANYDKKSGYLASLYMVAGDSDISNDIDGKGGKPPVDPVKSETLNIMNNMINLDQKETSTTTQTVQK